MNIFVLLAIPLAIIQYYFVFGAGQWRGLRKGLIIGLVYFIPWLILRLLLAQFFLLRPSIGTLYLSYTLFHTIFPLCILLFPIISGLHKYPDRDRDVETLGLIGVFFYLALIIDVFVFPVPGYMSRLFFLPLARIILVVSLCFIVKHWNTKLPGYQYFMLIMLSFLLFTQGTILTTEHKRLYLETWLLLGLQFGAGYVIFVSPQMYAQFLRYWNTISRKGIELMKKRVSVFRK